MSEFDLSQLTAVATFVVSLCAVGLVVAALATARREVLGSRRGWVLVASAIALLAVRVLGHFGDSDVFQAARHVLGIVAAPLLALGMHLVLRPEVAPRAA